MHNIGDTIEQMIGDTQAIRSYFFKLGLSSEIADIYIALYAYEAQTISELARHSGVERTRIYRLMDELKASNLVEIETQYKKSIFRAAPITNLQILISKKEQEVRELHADLAKLRSSLEYSSLASPATRVQVYQGVDGIKQMVWNETKGSSENLSILYENMQARTGRAFFERWVRRCNERSIAFRSIISDHFVTTQKQWYKKHGNERLAYWQGLYVPDSIFAITHSTVIYDDVTAYYNWKDGKVFGIEIHNAEIATAQRTFFELAWQLGVPFDDSQIEALRQQTQQ